MKAYLTNSEGWNISVVAKVQSNHNLLHLKIASQDLMMYFVQF